MRPLYAPSQVAELLRRYRLSPDRAFGQNFLIDRAVLAATVEAAGIGASDSVLEVGPGLGVLTRELAAGAGAVTAIEADPRLLPALTETLEGVANVELICGDALTFEMKRLPAGSLFISNPPYNLATPILRRVLESGRFRRAVVLLQREVADRLVARPGSRSYGALSLVREHYGAAERIRDVPPSCFLPPPGVTSSLVRLDLRPGVRVDPALFELIRDAFRHRRKTLTGNLVRAGHPKAVVRSALEAADIDERARAEELALADFRNLAEQLHTCSDRPPQNRLY